MSEMHDSNFMNEAPQNVEKTYDYNSYLKQTFLKMTIALGITSLVAWLCYRSLISGGIVYNVVVGFPYISLVLLAAQLVVAIILSAKLMKMKPMTVSILFYTYAFLTGLSFSILPLAYGVDNVFMAFGFAAGLFACMAIIGYTTKIDLTKWQPLLYVGLGILVIATIIGMFINLGVVDMIICYVGIGIFMGLTAFDMQKMKQYYVAYGDNAVITNKMSTYCAMQLYLDFINLFLYILRLLGGRSKSN